MTREFGLAAALIEEALDITTAELLSKLSNNEHERGMTISK
jgi:hypothetical protein